MKNETIITPITEECTDSYKKKKIKSLVFEFGKGVITGAVIGAAIGFGVNVLTNYIEALAEE